MLKLIFSTVSLLIGSSLFSQDLFTQSKPIVYTKVKFELVKDTSIPNKLVEINLKGKKGFAIDKVAIIEQESAKESSYIYIYKANKIIQKILVPFWIMHLTPNAEIADFNSDGIPDIKFRIYTGGNGMAALLNYKVFLISQQKKYKVMSFMDFSSEKEYDLNGDGLPEIIGCSSRNYNDHNYWVYNLYNWVNGTLKSVSKTYDYPLWTAVDFKTNKVIAKSIPASVRNATLRNYPNEYFVK